MSRKGFIDKNLFDLKDCIKNHSEEVTKENQNKVESEKTSETILHTTENIVENGYKTAYENNSACSNEPDESQIDEKYPNIDKDYYKALLARKREFIRTKHDVLKTLQKYIAKLPIRIDLYEKRLSETKNVNLKLSDLICKISQINEKQWDKNDFAVELAEAMKTVENARLEIITQQVKGSCPEEDNSNIPTSHNSFIHELLSLTFWQMFKIGFGFFMTVTVGILVSSVIIALAIMFSMGVI